MSNDRSIGFSIFATDKGAAKTFDTVAKSATGTEKAVGSANRNSHLGNIAAGATLAAGAVVAFGVSSVNAFKSAGSETLKLQKVYGGTAEDASRLRFVAKDTGVDIDLLAKGLAKASQAANSGKSFTALGIQAKDAHGKLKPMSELLPQLADKFSKMSAGPARTAAIMSIFGKSGLALTPILSRNSKELAELAKKSDEYGQTLNTKALKAMKASAQAQRDQKLAMDGVKVQLGGALMPLFATFTKVLATNVVPIITKVTGFFSQHKGMLLLVIGVITTLIVTTKAISVATTAWKTATTVASAATKIWGAIQAGFNLIMSANPIMLVVIAVAALVAGIVIAYKNSKTFRDIVEDCWKVIQSVVKVAWNTILKPIFNLYKLEFQLMIDYAKLLWKGVTLAWQGIGKIFQWLWNSIVKPIFNLWKAEVNLVLMVGNLLWKGINSAWNAIGKVFSWLYSAVVKPVFGLIKGEFNAISYVAGLLWGGIQTGVGWVGKAFGALSRGASWVAGAIGSAFSAIGGVVKGAINGVIDGINFFIRAIDAIKFGAHLPSWLGGAGFDFNGFGIPEIPRLAMGGIVRATPGGILANIGEGGRDEAVIPLPRSGGFGGDTYIVNVYGAVGSHDEIAQKLAMPIRKAMLQAKNSGGIGSLGLA